MEPVVEQCKSVSKLLIMMHKLQEMKVLCDVTIAADDGNIEAHSLVLAAVSPILCSTFVRLLGEISTRAQYSIDLTGFSTADVSAALCLLYTGELTAKGSTREEIIDRYQRVIQIYDSLGIDKEMISTEKCLTSKLMERSVAPDQKSEVPVMPVDTKENDEMFIIIESHNLVSTPCSNIASKEQMSMPDKVNFVVSTRKGEAPISKQSFIFNNETQGNHLAGKSHITGRGSMHMESRLMLSARGVFQSTRRRLANRERENKKWQKLTCSTCAQVFHSRAIFSRHFRTKHRCGVRYKQTRTRTSKQTAERLSAGETEGRVTLACESCGKCYRSAQCLAMHQLAHRGIKPFLCDSCGRGFHAQATLDRHVMLRHTDRRPFVCDRCGKGFVASSRLARHVETHDPTTRGRYACETCGADFANAGNLLRHRRLHSARPRPYSCDKCDKSFTQKTSLSAHSAVHDLEARRVTAKTCPICGKTLSKAANLDRHVQQLHNPRRHQALISEATSTSLRNDVQTALAAEDDFVIGREDTSAFDDGSAFDEAYVLRKT